jgi:hypothetical protein
LEQVHCGKQCLLSRECSTISVGISYFIKNNIGKHLPVEYVIYGSVGEDLVLSLYTCGRSMIYPQILYYIPEIADIVYHNEPAPKPHSLLVDTDGLSHDVLTGIVIVFTNMARSTVEFRQHFTIRPSTWSLSSLKL